jgi:hypothetical protein
MAKAKQHIKVHKTKPKKKRRNMPVGKKHRKKSKSL